VHILGADLPRGTPGGEPREQTVVLLDADGRIAGVEHVASLPAVAEAVGRLAGGEPFLLGVNVPVVVPSKQTRMRAVENLVRRRLGFRMPAGGRSASGGTTRGIVGETLIAGLAAAGQPCLPYPDRDGRTPGLAETHPGLILKSLMWESSPLASLPEQEAQEQLFRAYEPPSYRPARGRSRRAWAQRASNLDVILRALGSVAGFDLERVRSELSRAASERDVERVAGIFDAALIAGTVKRHHEMPETCLFLGHPEQGYVIIPADGLVRRLALSGTAAPTGQLFPQASLRERLGRHARLRPVGLFKPEAGRPQRIEASFEKQPRYEFDNVDEMLWWKHCRHLAGPVLPTEGLQELVVVVGAAAEHEAPLKLQRSRHQTLSFRFEPPTAWRAHVPTRDGKAYPFRVLRAVFETLPSAS
jgi:predicted RNase H-like nuclease